MPVQNLYIMIIDIILYCTIGFFFSKIVNSWFKLVHFRLM